MVDRGGAAHDPLSTPTLTYLNNTLIVSVNGWRGVRGQKEATPSDGPIASPGVYLIKLRKWKVVAQINKNFIVYPQAGELSPRGQGPYEPMQTMLVRTRDIFRQHGVYQAPCSLCRRNPANPVFKNDSEHYQPHG